MGNDCSEFERDLMNCSQAIVAHGLEDGLYSTLPVDTIAKDNDKHGFPIVSF